MTVSKSKSAVSDADFPARHLLHQFISKTVAIKMHDGTAIQGKLLSYEVLRMGVGGGTTISWLEIADVDDPTKRSIANTDYVAGITEV